MNLDDTYFSFFRICFNFYKQVLDLFIHDLIISPLKRWDIPVEQTTKTKFPVCPWCGHKQKNYEDFAFPDSQVLFCKKDTTKKFAILRIVEANGSIKYSTMRVIDDKRKL